MHATKREPSASARSSFQRRSDLAAGLLVVAVLAVMIGWHLQIVALIQIHPNFAPMQYNTALCFLMCGLGLRSQARRSPKALLTLALIVVAVSGWTLIEYVIGFESALDTLFVAPYVTTATMHPGRMAPNTALSFLLSGTALAMSRYAATRPSLRMPIAVIGSIVAGLASIAFLVYVAGSASSGGWKLLTGMALHTSIGMLIIGTLLAAIAWGQTNPGSVTLPPWAPLIPAVIGVTVSSCVGLALAASESDAVHTSTASAMKDASRHIQLEIYNQTKAFRRLCDRWKPAPARSNASWEDAARDHLSDFASLKALAWVDPDLQPLRTAAASESASSHSPFSPPDFASDPKLRRAFDRAESLDDTVIAAASQGTEFPDFLLMISPLIREETSRGFMIAFLNVNELLTPFIETPDRISARILIDGGEIYSAKALDHALASSLPQSVEFESENALWKIEAAPTSSETAAIRSRLPVIAFILGSAFA